MAAQAQTAAPTNGTDRDVPLISVRDLRTYFYTHEGVVQAVNGVSFDARAGETVALVGESGCGKSVTSLSIMRLVADPPGKIVSGEVMFEGENLLAHGRTRTAPHSRRRNRHDIPRAQCRP